MPTITFVAASGDRKTVTAKPGESVMRAAVANDIPEIEAECGGSLACATCHVYVDLAWVDKLPPKDPLETDMLDMAEHDVKPESRLSCQITMTEALDGLVIGLPG